MRFILLVLMHIALASAVFAQAKTATPKEGTTTAPKSSPSPANAGPKKEWKEAFDDWILACAQADAGQKSCAISQTLTNTPSRQLIGAISIGKDKAGKVVVNLQTPLGFAVNEGIKLTIDTQPGIALPVRTCLANGCLGILELDQPTIGKLQKASQLAMSLQSLQATPVVVKFSAKGLGKALDQLLKEGT
ncbi:MAG: invasion associated locus B family protein [Hyphomicrobium sp.]|jgi:invasion protein IalB